MLKSDAELVDECNKLAQMFYRSHGYDVGPKYLMYDATHPQERAMWNMAVMAYEHIDGTDIEEALRNLEAEEDDQ
jgi:hypothetical protein